MIALTEQIDIPAPFERLCASPFGFAALAFGYEISCYATSYAAASEIGRAHV